MNEPAEMTVQECLELLNGGVFGRVALCTPVGPRIVPVNYAMDGDSIVFRTTPYSELGTYVRNSDLAFEVDHLDYEKHQGWSVVAMGRGSIIEDPTEVQELRRAWGPRPWASGQRNLYLRLVWRDLTGRRLGADWTHASVMPERRVV
jgi:uncharacterized protein